jgi:hypothetical protein
MRRREFIAGIGSAAAWPVVARAQRADRRVGFLRPGLHFHVVTPVRMPSYTECRQMRVRKQT